jgi:predicted kinase
MKVTILRGISGSGKSTWAKEHGEEALVVSADVFFLQDGTYQFDPSRLQEVHINCFRRFMEAIFTSVPWVIVDNTNISAWEYSPYVLAAQAYGYEVEILTFNCSVELSRSRKNLVPLPSLHRTCERCNQETLTMPSRFKPLHRVVEQDAT